MKISKREQWEHRLLRYFADRLMRVDPKRYRHLGEAHSWWERPSGSISPPPYLRNDLALLDEISRWIREELRDLVASPIKGVAEDGDGYRTASTQDESHWRGILEAAILRDRPHFFPVWHASPPPHADSEFRRLVGHSRIWQDTLRMVRIAAASDVTTLIVGETGTGKNLVANVIHAASRRRANPFVRVNCVNLTRDNMASVLRLHAASGDEDLDEGLLHGGTIFLDNISALRLDVQPHLLQYIEMLEERASSMGNPNIVPRLIVANPIPLERRVNLREFRRDLYFRLSIFQIDLPPLRQRRDDIEVLVNHLLPLLASRNQVTAPSIAADALVRLKHHIWPGNVRELSNVLARAMLLADHQIRAEHIQFEPPPDPSPGSGDDFENTVIRIVRRLEDHGFRMNGAMPEMLVNFLLSLGMRRFRTQELADDLGVASSTARAYLAKLAEFGCVRKFGEKKGTTYQVVPEKLGVK